jgi:hypothetical protein
MRCQQDVELPELADRNPCEIQPGLGNRLSILEIPGGVTADEKDLLLLTLQRSTSSAPGRIVAVLAGELLARGARQVIDSSQVACVQE